MDKTIYVWQDTIEWAVVGHEPVFVRKWPFSAQEVINVYRWEVCVKITKEEILYVANLARVELDAVAIEKFVDQIGTVLDYVDQLKGVDTEGVRPTSHAISLTNAFREDKQTGHLDPAAALTNAPEKENGSFIVPKVVG